MIVRDARGRFTSPKVVEDGTYTGLDLTDPEVREIIRDISRPNMKEPTISSIYYVVWVVGSAFAIFAAFFLGTIAYR